MTGSVVAIRVPKGSANDEVMRVVRVHMDDGTAVIAGAVVCEVEGAKAVIEVESPSAGVFHCVAAVGDELPVGAVIGVIAPEPMDRDEALAQVSETSVPQVPRLSAEGARFSKAAAALVAERGIDPGKFAGRGLVTLAMIEVAEDRPPEPDAGAKNGRVLVIGAGSGANQILSVLLPDPGSDVVGLLDDDPAKEGGSIFGVPVIGRVSDLARLAGEGRADSVFVATSRNPAFRRQVAEAARTAGLRLANAVHSTAVFDAEVRIGGGNYIGPFCYLGAATRMGDMCYLSSRTTFEHHNDIGDHVTTGPNVATSGHVTIGDGVRFGAGIVVEPGLNIGAGAVIASGVSVTIDVSAGATIKGRIRSS